MTNAVQREEHGETRRFRTTPALAGRTGAPKNQRISVSVKMRPQSPEEERRCAAAVRLFLAAITREHIERCMKEGVP